MDIIEHTQDEYGEDRWYVVNEYGDWVGESFPTRELAAEAAPRVLADDARRRAEHRTETRSVRVGRGSGWLAICHSCDWEGKPRRARETADDEAATHAGAA